MIAKLIEFSIRNRWLVLLGWIGVAIWGVYAMLHTPVDAIPDLSENQVIVFADWMGRSPQEIEDQVTYPLSVQLQGLAGVKWVRSSSEPNFSMISVIFDDKTDPYFARTRILERLSTVRGSLPADVTPQLAPDATALGQIFWYTVEGKGHSLDELRAVQDFVVRYQLSAIPGVAEVASVGGFVREYQVDVDPAKLRLYQIPLSSIYSAIANSNMSVGAKVVVQGNTEYLIRGLGWLRGLKDLENVEVANRGGVPITLNQLAALQMGPEFRRSALEKDGQEVVGGMVMMRLGENPLDVTRLIKAKIRELQPGLPEGVRIVPFYDRTRLIESAIHTVTGTLKEEMLIASIAVLLILFGVRGRGWQILFPITLIGAAIAVFYLSPIAAVITVASILAGMGLLAWKVRAVFDAIVASLRTAFVVCVTLPMAVLTSFLFMYYLHIPSNIMSLCGIAISIGILVDAAVVMVENATHELKVHFGDNPVAGDTTEIVVRACRLVGRPIFFSVLIMLISFLPVFALGGMEGKLSHPLAFTKSFAMIGVAIMAITLVPALIPLFIKGHVSGEEENPIVRSFIHIYKPMLSWMVDRPAAVWWIMGVIIVLGAAFFRSPVVGQAALGLALAMIVFFVRGSAVKKLILIVTITGIAFYADTRFTKLGSEFKPSLNEGSIMDMPSASPRIAMAQAVDDVMVRDRIMAGFPEVEQVVGKVGRAETATDPSPLEMVETVVNLRPLEHWPKRRLDQADADAQAKVVARELQSRGWLTGEASRDMLHKSVTEMMTRFDRDLRRRAKSGIDLHQWTIADTLGARAIDAVIAQAKLKSALLAIPSDDQRSKLTQAVREHTWRLAALPRVEEVDALLTMIKRELARSGLIQDRDELLIDQPGIVATAWNGLRRAIGGEVPDLSQRLLAEFETTREAMTRKHIESLDRELFTHAVRQINAFLIESLLSEAKPAGIASKTEPTAQQINDLAIELSPPLGKKLFLWAKSKAEIEKEMDAELQMPGWGNQWTQPIQNRINMLATGVRMPLGVKVFGPIAASGAEGSQDVTAAIERMQKVSDDIAVKLRTIPGAYDVVVDQAIGKRYLEIHVDREKLSRYGVNISDVNQAIETALGGSRITMTVEGRQRFGVRLRYARDYWQDIDAIGNVLVNGTATPATLAYLGGSSSAGSAAPSVTMRSASSSGMGGMGGGGMGGGMSAGSSGGSGGMSGGMGGGMGAPAAPAPGRAMQSSGAGMIPIPLKMLADIRITEGPAMIKSENGRLRNYVTLGVRDRDLLGFVDEARQALKPIEAQLAGTGMSIEWTGDFEHQMRTNQTLTLIFPMVIVLILFLLYFTFHDFLDTLLVLLAVLGALAGAVMFQAFFGFNFSVIVSIGYIAAFGMATQTGVIMLVYLREAVEKHGGLEGIRSLDELRAAIIEGAVHRLRPKLLTEGVAIVGLVPMLWAVGTGAEIMRPMAAPVLGGLLISDEVIDLMIPVLFFQIRKRRWLKLHKTSSPVEPPPQELDAELVRA